MIRINLLPPEAIKREAEEKTIILVALGATLILTLGIVVFLFRVTVERTLSYKLSNLEKELKEYQTAVNEVKKLKDITKTLETKKNLIENLKKSSLIYPKFMEKFLSLLPPQIWLISFYTTSNPNGFTVTITCSSYDNFAIADFIYNLESSPEFSGVELGNITSSVSSSGLEIFNFQLKFEYKAI
ncbi:MAG: PilN domain-containing protein [Endomicrobiia bacterium]